MSTHTLERIEQAEKDANLLIVHAEAEKIALLKEAEETGRQKAASLLAQQEQLAQTTIANAKQQANTAAIHTQTTITAKIQELQEAVQQKQGLAVQQIIEALGSVL